jgi:hypothetical protein
VTAYALARQRVASFRENPLELTDDERNALTTPDTGKAGTATQRRGGG